MFPVTVAEKLEKIITRRKRKANGLIFFSLRLTSNKSYSLDLRLALNERKTTKPTPTKTTTKASMTPNLMTIVRNPKNAITCFSKVTIRARMTKTLPHFPVAFNQVGIILKLLKTAVSQLAVRISTLRKHRKSPPFHNTRFSNLFSTSERAARRQNRFAPQARRG